MKLEILETDRNSLALDRTVLANERTYQAWLRTGLTALVSGLGVAKFLKDVVPLWILLTISTVLILFAAVAFLQAAWRYSHTHLRMAHLNIEVMPIWVAKVVSVLLAGCSILALAGLLVTVIH